MKAWAMVAMTCLTGCATTAPPIEPPNLQMPQAATEACVLHRLPDLPTLADLEITLAVRGAALVECDGRRRLAVETAQAEDAMQTQWRAQASASHRTGLFGWFSRGKSAGAAASRP
jgi:hypothetical protein